jgi:hypothetical protein
MAEKSLYHSLTFCVATITVHKVNMHVTQPDTPPTMFSVTCEHICGIIVVTACSTVLWNSSLLQLWCAATCPLTVRHNEWPGMVKSGLRGDQNNGCWDNGKNHGQSSTWGSVLKCHSQWGWSVKWLIMLKPPTFYEFSVSKLYY